MPSLLKRVAIVGVTAGALTLAASPAFAGGPPSHSDSSKKDQWSSSEHKQWSANEHEKWSKDPSGGVETGVGGAAQSTSSFPAAPAAAALGGAALIGGGMITRRRRGVSQL